MHELRDPSTELLAFDTMYRLLSLFLYAMYNGIPSIPHVDELVVQMTIFDGGRM